MKGKNLKKASILLTLFILLSAAHSTPVCANDIHAVEIWVDIHNDGSASVKEAWDITMTNSSNTEWYVAKYNLDNMKIQNLVVEETDGNGAVIPFETLSEWDVNASREEKAGKCGLVVSNGGYEVCWGFGELGRHKYTITYEIANIVKGYQGGDAMSYNFLSKASGGVNVLNIYINADDFLMEYPQTKAWVFGCQAEYNFTNGGIEVLGQGRFSENDYAAVLLAFEPGLVSPTDKRSETLDDIIKLNMEGSIWEEKGGAKPAFLIFVIILLILVAFLIFTASKAKGRLSQKIVKGRNAGYFRELPFGGNLCAAYTRLCDIYQLKENAVIGCFLLKWIQTGQVDISAQASESLLRREKVTIQLREIKPDTPSLEAELYNMFVAAAGSDSILQDKEFEKWAAKKYKTIENWFDRYRKAGRSDLINMGAYAEVPVKLVFGLIKTTSIQVTSAGEEMTNQVFAFKHFLEDYSLIDEREAREVTLWEQYLVFAQLLGIADRVAKQFKQLYPDYFAQPNTSDILVATAVSNTFAHSMYSGYSSGRNAASGGGGHSSFSGGGGSSGGGGAGGR